LTVYVYIYRCYSIALTKSYEYCSVHTKEMFLVKSKHMWSRSIDQCFGNLNDKNG
jgi:hypothetical protein